MSKKKIIICVIAAFLTGALVTGGVAAAVVSGFPASVKVERSEYKKMSEVYERYSKLDEIYNTLDKYYYQDIDEDKLLDGAYCGMVSALGDKYSAYLDEETLKKWNEQATGEYSGIGITFAKSKEGDNVIVSVNKESPAEKSGLKAGDKIITVDGKEYDDVEAMSAAIKGKAGTDVEITYSRDGSKKTVKITRAEIIQHSVEYKILDDGTGYIQISSFLKSTTEDFDKALKYMEENNVKGLVVDLRNNGGGLVDSCVDIADEFLDEGVVTYIEDGDGNRNEYKSEDGKTTLKTVVLVNENSASASEIMAAALQDNGFKIVGTNTFGKGVIQATLPLEDGSAVKLTVYQYFSPADHAINNKGVKPDYIVKNTSEESDEQLEKALNILK